MGRNREGGNLLAYIYVYAYIKVKDDFKSTALAGASRVGSTVRFTSKGSSDFV